MIVPVVLAIAFALGADWRKLVLLAGAIYLPLAVAALVALLSWRQRSGEDHRPSQFCEGIAAELRAGASLRDALLASDLAVGSEAFVDTPASASIHSFADVAGETYPSIGQELRLTVINAARSGSQVASLFDEIGSLALARAEVEREVRVATAPGRATALLLVGAPLAYLIGQATSGNLERMLRSSQQRVVAMIGLGLFLFGLVVTVLVVWRASR